MDIRALWDGRLVFGAQDPAFGVFDRNGKKVLTRGPDSVDYRDRRTKELAISHDGGVVEFDFRTLTAENRWNHHTARLQLTEGQLLVDGKPNPTLKRALGVTELQPSRTTGLDISDWDYHYEPKLNGKPLPLKPYERSWALAIAPDSERFLLGTEWNLRLFDRHGTQLWAVDAPSTTWAVNISGDGPASRGRLQRWHPTLVPDERWRGTAGSVPTHRQ